MYETPNAFADSIGIRTTENEPILLGTIESSNPAAATGERHKVFLPHRPGESRFAPRQYYYAASRTGVYPASRAAIVPHVSSEAA